MNFGPLLIWLSAGLLMGATLSFTFTADLAAIYATVSLPKLVAAIVVPLFIVVRGLKKKSLSLSGCVLGYFVAFVLTLAQWSFMVSLLTFFLTSSKATRFREHQKRKIEGEAFKAGGQRDWVQVFCNGGVATLLALLYLLQVGPLDLPIDFQGHPDASSIAAAVLGAIACCCGDTWASELGSVLCSSGAPGVYLLTTFRRVPKGTNGGVSAAGLVASLGGGLTIGLAFVVGQVIGGAAGTEAEFHRPLMVVLLGGVLGLIGSLIDSLLGATLQYSGQTASGAIVETTSSSKNVKHISGFELLDNHSVNLLSCLLTATIAPQIAQHLL